MLESVSIKNEGHCASGSQSIIVPVIPLVNGIEGLAQQQVLIILKNQLVYQYAVLEFNFFSLDLLSFDSFFHPFLPLGFHIAEKVLQISEWVYELILLSLLVHGGNEKSFRVL